VVNGVDLITACVNSATGMPGSAGVSPAMSAKREQCAAKMFLGCVIQVGAQACGIQDSRFQIPEKT
jgi:hypothetical protein